MLRQLFKKRAGKEDRIATAVVDQTAKFFEDLQRRIDLRFNELSAQVKEVELGLEQLETKLLTKDLKDKQAYGLLHYKLHEVRSPKVTEEIKELEEKLKVSHGRLKDQ